MKQHYLTPSEWLRLIHLFRSGRDTLQLAATFDVSEAYIYNRLAVYRMKYRATMDRSVHASGS